MNQEFIMSPGYITGLTQTDGSFFCTVSLSAKALFGLQFRPKFTITTDLDSKYVLDGIQNYLGCGVVIMHINKHAAELVVDRLDELYNLIIPHFKKFPIFFQ